MLSLGIIMGLVAMLCWGIADFIQALIVRKITTNKTFLAGGIISTIVSMLALAGYLVLGGRLVLNSIEIVLISLGCLLQTYASYNFYKSLEIGEVSIVAPISGTYSLITVILAVLFLGEILSLVKIISLILIILGIVFVSTDLSKLRHIHTVKGVKEVLIAVFGWGLYFFILGLVKTMFLSRVQTADATTTLGFNIFMLTNLFGAIFILVFSRIKKIKVERQDFKSKKVLVFFAINAVLYTLAWIAMNIGIVSEMISLLAPISSIYPAVTIALAAIFLKEKLVKNQFIGIVMLLTGIFLLGF